MGFGVTELGLDSRNTTHTGRDLSTGSREGSATTELKLEAKALQEVLAQVDPIARPQFNEPRTKYLSVTTVKLRDIQMDESHKNYLFSKGAKNQEDMNMRFDGKVGLVTGGGSGIGRATAIGALRLVAALSTVADINGEKR
jgi:hypothetical protein